MARPRSFDAAQAVAAAAACFRRLGYAATSVDDLVTATGLHRGSLYGAFGSKRGLFLAALALVEPRDERPEALDLLLVAALELAPHDEEVRTVVARACASLPGEPHAVLGRRLLARALAAPDPSHPTSRRS